MRVWASFVLVACTKSVPPLCFCPCPLQLQVQNSRCACLFIAPTRVTRPLYGCTFLLYQYERQNAASAISNDLQPTPIKVLLSECPSCSTCAGAPRRPWVPVVQSPPCLASQYVLVNGCVHHAWEEAPLETRADVARLLQLFPHP